MTNRGIAEPLELQQLTCQEHGAFGIHPTYKWMFSEGERFDVMCPHGPHYIQAVLQDGRVQLIWSMPHAVV